MEAPRRVANPRTKRPAFSPVRTVRGILVPRHPCSLRLGFSSLPSSSRSPRTSRCCNVSSGLNNRGTCRGVLLCTEGSIEGARLLMTHC